MRLPVGNLSLFVISFILTTSINADTTKSYTDYRNNIVKLPAGSASFIDRVAGRKKGKKKLVKMKTIQIMPLANQIIKSLEMDMPLH